MPLGLLAGVILPWAAAKPFSQAIPLFIGLLLFLSVLRLLSVSRELNGQSSCSKPGTTTTVFAQADYIALLLRVLLAQLLLPLGVYALGMYFGLPLAVVSGLHSGCRSTTNLWKSKSGAATAW